MTINDSNPTFLSLKDVDIYRQLSPVLSNVNWEIKNDEHWIITGANGTGKTSLAYTIAGKSLARRGKLQYHFLEKEAAEKNVSIYDVRRNAIAIISFEDSHRAFNNKERYYQQRFNAFDNDGITVQEYLEELGYDSTSAKQRNIIEKCGVSKWLHLSRIKLSSGQSRKLLISTALLKQPRLLIIDNPYIGLDDKNRQLFNELIDELTISHNIKIILAGHFHQLPKCITHELYLSENSVSIKKISPSYINNSVSKPEYSEAISEISAYFGDTTHHPSFKNALLLDDLNVEYKDANILTAINWKVKLGNKWALLGPNGSGKSTMLGMIAADHPKVYANNVYLFDKKRGVQDSIWDIKKNIGFISSEMHTYFNYDINKTVSKIILDGLFTSIYSRPPITQKQQGILNALLTYFECQHIKECKFQYLSTGEQRLTLILRALVKNPPLLLFDEPFQGLDDQTISRFKYLLDEVLTDKHALIFITHYQHEVPSCVDEYFYLKGGERV